VRVFLDLNDRLALRPTSELVDRALIDVMSVLEPAGVDRQVRYWSA
jgi:hypothetical protein